MLSLEEGRLLMALNAFSRQKRLCQRVSGYVEGVSE